MSRRTNRHLSTTAALLLIGCMVAVAAAGWWLRNHHTTPAAPTTTATVTATEAAQPDTTDSSIALQQLAALKVADPEPKTGYTRDQFGSAWTDDNNADPGGTSHNGCSTRDDILARDMQPHTTSGKCKVTTGVLHDTYSGKTIDFRCGPKADQGKCSSNAAATVQIDHVVALGNAWVSGAQHLTREQRTALANDPLNLQAVDGPLNGSKSDQSAATWLPPNTSYRHTYCERQVAVKTKYQLTVTAAERDALTQCLR